MITKTIQISDKQDEFVNSKVDGRRFNLSGFVRAKLDEWMELCQKEI